MQRPFQIVGVLNVTPDSYYDGGRFVSPKQAVERVGEMLREGADIIEIGGESTGPGSPGVSEEEELRRVVGTLHAVREAHPAALLSVDTCKARVAAEAVDAGACMVNDVTAGRFDAQMFPALAASQARCVLMYAKDETPRTTVSERQYDDVVSAVRAFLADRKEAAIRAGIAQERIILDPGMGHFVSSDPRYSFELLARLHELSSLGSPLFVSPSRKSFLAGREGLAPEQRLPGTVAASAIAVLHGAAYIRTHDVEAVRQGCEVALEVAERAR